jgi:hypothetical protein
LLLSARLDIPSTTTLWISSDIFGFQVSWWELVSAAQMGVSLFPPTLLWLGRQEGISDHLHFSESPTHSLKLLSSLVWEAGENQCHSVRIDL